MIGILGLVLLLVGLALGTYWLLFMSWSHSFASPGFQSREAIVLLAAVTLAVTGLALLVLAAYRRWRRSRTLQSR